MKTEKSFSRFLIIWSGQLFSGLGTGMTTFALGVSIFSQTSSSQLFAMTVLCGFLPSMIFRPIGGVLADRIDRRLMIALGDFGSGAGVLLILVSLLGGDFNLWIIYTGLAVSSLFTGIQSPAYKAAATDLLGKQQYSRAAGLMQLASASQHLVSPFAAGILLSFASLETVLIIDIATFITAFSAALFTGPSLCAVQNDTYKGIIAELTSGWKCVMQHARVVRILCIVTLVTFCVGFVQTLLGPMILSFSNSTTLGTVQSLSASGMLITSIVIGIAKNTGSHNTILSTSLILAGIFLVLMGLRPNSFLITAGGFLFFCTLPFINTSADVLLRTTIPSNAQGKAWAFIGFITQSGYAASYVLSGFAADKICSPLMLEGGMLSQSLGRIIGTGTGRGNALLIILAGIGISLTGLFSIKALTGNKIIETEDRILLHQNNDADPETINCTL